MTSPILLARRLLVIVVIALSALVLTSCGSSSDNDALPDLELEQIPNGTLDLRETGEPRVLNLWATWCAPCRAELPAFDEVAARTDHVDIIGINVGESAEQAAELIDELGLGFPQALDPRARIQASLRITGMPATIFVAPDGEVLEIHSGELERAELEELIATHYPLTP